MPHNMALVRTRREPACHFKRVGCGAPHSSTLDCSMLSAVAEFTDRRVTRVCLATLGVVGTIVLAPIATVGAIGGLVGPFVDPDPELRFSIAIALIGFGGIIGISAAWCRVIMRNVQFQRSRGLYLFTTIGLIVGLATVIVQLAGTGGKSSHPLFWAYLAVLLIGILLLMSTLGAKRLQSNSTVEGTGQERPAPHCER